MRLLLIVGGIVSQLPAFAAPQESADRTWPAGNLHVQATAVSQAHPDITSPYEGSNSLQGSAEVKTSFTLTVYGAVSLWNGGLVVFNPEVTAGRGLSGTLGLAGFPNGDIFRVADPELRLYFARAFVEQTIPLGGSVDTMPDEANRPAGMVDSRRLVVRAGKFSLTDYFDTNEFSHEPRTQFMNWALMSNGAWDYAADTRGYTWGITGEWFDRDWTVRGAACMVPVEANQMELDERIGDAHGLNVEVTHSYMVAGRKGIVHLLAYQNTARMGNYREALAASGNPPDLSRNRRYSRTKTGLGLNVEQRLSANLGVFLRTGWNDGHNETWAFTEIDRTLSAGGVLFGQRWGRSDDWAGLALTLNGLSDDHRDYLSAGGYGFIIGDGGLNYGPEAIFEGFYAFRATDLVTLTADYQFVVNPAYNRDRGPVHIVGLRVHVEY